MAGLDDLLGGILGGAASGGQQQAAAPGGFDAQSLNRIMMVVGPMIAAFAASGGLQELLKKLTSGGLGAQSNSWVGTGGNEPVSAEQIEAALPDEVSQIAAQTGMSPQEVSASMAEVLPGLVDKLSPEGQLPQSGAGLDDLMAGLPGGDQLKGLFGM